MERKPTAPPPRVRIDITITLPRRPRWLLTGLALGSAHVPHLVALVLHATRMQS